MTDHAVGGEPAKPAGRKARLLRYAMTAVSFVLAAVALIRFFDTSLPGCTSSRAHDTLVSILRDKNVTGATLSGKREVSKDPNEIRCAADLSGADGARYDLTYRVYRGDDGKAMVAAEWRRL